MSKGVDFRMLSKVFYFQITVEMSALRTHRIQILQGLQGIQSMSDELLIFVIC